jgi:hypothetical protein
MRWFWTVIALLAAAGMWFVVAPRAVTPPSAAIDATAESTPEPTQAPTSKATQEPTPKPTPTPAPASATAPTPEIDLLGESGIRIPAAPPIPADTRSPNEVVRRIDERTLELDGRFRVTGNGRPDDPYRISWELLTSASSSIDPARKALTPPPWVRLVDGTSIEISGYYSTAVRVAVAKNLLLTLNRWDGCCIGLPPTPFDAIDMTMRTPVPMQGLHLFRFGTFRGRLVVEPFETGGFLLGLYRLEDVTFESAK